MVWILLTSVAHIINSNVFWKPTNGRYINLWREKIMDNHPLE